MISLTRLEPSEQKKMGLPKKKVTRKKRTGGGRDGRTTQIVGATKGAL